VANRAFDIQGHRGARGLRPENTLPAFTHALDLGVTTLELDCGLTRDHVVVISHDRRLNPAITRTEDARWIEGLGPAIRDLTFDELRRYEVGRIKPGSTYAQRFPRQEAVDGTRIPRLTDLFTLVRERGNDAVRFNIETKLSPLAPEETASPEAFVDALLQVIADAGLQSRTIVQSFYWRTLRLVQEVMPAIATSCLTAGQMEPNNVSSSTTASLWTDGFDRRAFGGSVPRMIEAAGGSTWSPDYSDLTPEALSEAHSLGLKVVPWTVNTESDMRRLIEWGVDGLITDYPDVLVPVTAELRRTTSGR
jgi:glycerophosphoryl diester phosphodiesterase